MARDPERTRREIMDAAEALVLDHGFAGASVSAIIGDAGVTKGAFFHHFSSKNDLARALVERFAALDRDFLARAVERSERYGRDPVQRLLIFLSILDEHLEGLAADASPGCLYASYFYQPDLFDDDTLEIIREAVLDWRERLLEMFRDAAAVRPPTRPVDLVDLADMLTVVYEGAFVMARTLRDPGALQRQHAHYRTYIELLFGVESEGEEDGD